MTDLAILSRLCIGQGYDIHRLVADRPLKLGGVTIESSALGSLGHSDGDVVLHALMDAMIGAAGLPGDIGLYFPPTDPAWKGANSVDLCNALIKQLPPITWLQVDITVFLEAPKLKPYKDVMAHAIQTLLACPKVSVKAKTAEGLGDIGQCQAIAASVLVLGVVQ
jgi:2-C-methyl-D-erythritol 2,4-cyclodiphosphate synthase